MKVIVCGGREYSDKEHVYRVLDEISPTFLVEGGALGADRLARMWANERRVDFKTIEARWREFGASAGPRRNQQMAQEGADLLIAFPGGVGTADMIRKAKKHGIPVRIAAPLQKSHSGALD